MTDHPPRLVIVAGPPASGKSTLARRLRDALAAVTLEPDRWLEELALDPLDVDVRDRVEALQAQLAGELLERGLSVVLDWGAFSRAKRDALRALARERGAPVELHFLSVAPDELWRRMTERDGDDAPTRAEFDAMLDDVEPPGDDERALFDAPACPGLDDG